MDYQEAATAVWKIIEQCDAALDKLTNVSEVEQQQEMFRLQTLRSGLVLAVQAAEDRIQVARQVARGGITNADAWAEMEEANRRSQ